MGCAVAGRWRPLCEEVLERARPDPGLLELLGCP